MEEHYKAQIKYADMLFKFLEIKWYKPIKKMRASIKAKKFRDSHKKCCEWANERDY